MTMTLRPRRGASKQHSAGEAGEAAPARAAVASAEETRIVSDVPFGGLGRLYIFCLLFRLANAVAIKTFFCADEYWQSSEVAHRLVFGYGYLTWEWRAGIRGWLHPLPFAALYWVLAAVGLDSPAALALGPRLLQAPAAAAADAAAYHLARRLFGPRAAQWALFCTLSSWFAAYCSVRPFSNSLEGAFAAIAFALWPWPTIHRSALSSAAATAAANAGAAAAVPAPPPSRHRRTAALVMAALQCAVRPAGVPTWILPAISEIRSASDPRRFVFLEVIPIATFALGGSFLLDSWLHGSPCFAPARFLRFNLLTDGSAAFGSHPWHWYLSQGIPAVGGALIAPALFGLWRATERGPAAAAAAAVFALSFAPHKEFRFLMPLLPVLTAYAGLGFALLEAAPGAAIPADTQGKSVSSVGSDSGTRRVVHHAALRLPMRRRAVAAACTVAAAHLIAAAYLGRVHQSAPEAAMALLAAEAASGLVDPSGGILMLTPCHQTPGFSHLHAPVPLAILDCAPQPDGAPHEERIFLDSPSEALRERFRRLEASGDGGGGDGGGDDGTWARSPPWLALAGSASRPSGLPSHVVFFDDLAPALRPLLEARGYRPLFDLFHAHFAVDRAQRRLLCYVRGGRVARAAAVR